MTVPPTFSARFAGAVVRYLIDHPLIAGLPAHLAGDKVLRHEVFADIPKTSTWKIHTMAQAV